MLEIIGYYSPIQYKTQCRIDQITHLIGAFRMLSIIRLLKINGTQCQ